MNDLATTRTVLVQDGRMTIEGVSERFVHGIGRRLRLDALNLHLSGGFEMRDGSLVETGGILGEATLVSDKLKRIGEQHAAGSLPLAIRPLRTGDQNRMLITIGARDGDESGYSAELHLPSTVFATLKEEVLSGAARQLSLTAATSLWLDERESGSAPGLPVTWHLGPAPDGRGTVPARGLIESINWRAGEAPQAPATLARTVEDEGTHEALTRINWSLKQLLIVLAFLMLIVALK